jgi:hypothetical protein
MTLLGEQGRLHTSKFDSFYKLNKMTISRLIFIVIILCNEIKPFYICKKIEEKGKYFL